MAPPSPRIMPLRSLENGRHVPVETTRRASQALSRPRLKGASLPPTSATGAAPEATMEYPRPTACAAEEHAVEMVNAAPVIPSSMQIRLAPAFAMVLGMVMG